MSFEYAGVKKNRGLGWDFTSKFDHAVEPNELAKFTKMETSFIGMFHKKNMLSINLFHAKGFSGLGVNSRFSRCAMKITEKVTAILVPIASCK